MIRKTRNARVRGPEVLLALMTFLAACATGYENGSATARPEGPGAAPLEGQGGIAQAGRGEKLYAENCASCHGDQGEGSISSRGRIPPIVGQWALPIEPPSAAKYRKQPFRNARDVYDFVKTSMPPGMGGSLPDQDYLDIVAFALKANGVDLRGKTITPDTLSGLRLRP
jgi:cytochrome c